MIISRLGSTLAWAAAVCGIGALVVVGASDGDGLGTLFAQGSVPAVFSPEAAPVSTASGCANPQPEWLWCDDFEQDRTGRYFEYASSNGSLKRQPGAGVDGSSSMRARWAAGQVDAGSLKIVFGRNPLGSRRLADDGTAVRRELYWRVYVRSQAGWRANGNDKFTRAIVFAGDKWQEAAIGHVWGGGAGQAQGTYVLDPASGVDARGQLATTQYNDFQHLTWLGAVPGRTPLLGAGAGRWHCVEAHMRLNDAGAANGVLELWVDDQLDARRTDLNWLGAYSAYGINALFLESYINNGAPQAQVRDYDDLIVSSTRIGCVA